MSSPGVIEKLMSHLKERRCQSRIVSIESVRELHDEIHKRRAQGLFNDKFYETYLSGFSFDYSESLPGARSLIVVAIPKPQTRVVFTWQGKPLPSIIPPTYVGYRSTREEMGQYLSTVLNPAGYRLAQTALPLKLLAVRCGLAKYGRNNISYVDGMGSFHQLAAYFSDLPCLEDTWGQPVKLERCENCRACKVKCPTDAIMADRFLLRAERCLTFLNELPGNFPEWLDQASHNCLVGCMRCQTVCPENKPVRRWIEEGPEFSEEETALILEGVSLDHLPHPTVEKLWRLDLLADYYDVIPRNLCALAH